jgi:hypothetical protein
LAFEAAARRSEALAGAVFRGLAGSPYYRSLRNLRNLATLPASPVLPSFRPLIHARLPRSYDPTGSGPSPRQDGPSALRSLAKPRSRPALRPVILKTFQTPKGARRLV